MKEKAAAKLMTIVGGAAGRAALPWLGIFFLATVCSFAAPPANFTPDPELRAWFKALHRPGTDSLCCDISDCRFVAFSNHDGRFEVEIEGFRYAVPQSIILQGIANPTGKAVACYTATNFGLPLPPGVPDVIELMCFVPPRPVS